MAYLKAWLLRKVLYGERGTSLIETAVALALMGIIGVAFLSAITTASSTMAIASKKVDVENLARAQMEYTKDAAYIAYNHGALPGNPSDDIPPSYATLDGLSPSDPYAIILPPGYVIDVDAVALHEPDAGIQEITVTIGRSGTDLHSLKGYKVNR